MQATLAVRTVAAPSRPCPAARPRALHARVPRSAVPRAVADVSGEWEAVESLGSMDDVLAFYNHQHEGRKARLADVMQTNLVVASPSTSLADVAKLLDGPPSMEGAPVVDSEGKLVGVISRKDLDKGGSVVADAMSSPALSLKATGTVSDAAELMIKHKFHRVPVVDDAGACVGLVTRTDVFWALTQSDQEGDTHLTQLGLDV